MAIEEKDRISCHGSSLAFWPQAVDQSVCCSLWLDTCTTMDYNADGSVNSWGPANETMYVRANGGTGLGCHTVQSWRLLRVGAYVRYIEDLLDPEHGDDGWHYYCSFWVTNWADIKDVFNRYFGIRGLYFRTVFHVEVCCWNSVEGWNYDDCV